MHSKDSEPRSKAHRTKKNTQKKNGNARWIVTVFFAAMAASAAISFLSSAVLEGAGLFVALAVLLVIVLIGVLFDMIGVAVISANEKPFHSMASKKVVGASEAISLLRNAEKVSGICNDVVGDICGVVSGSASAFIAVRAFASIGSDTVSQLIMSAVVAGATIAGKACGKDFAIRKSTEIVHLTAKLIYYIKSPFRWNRKKK